MPANRRPRLAATRRPRPRRARSPARRDRCAGQRIAGYWQWLAWAGWRFVALPETAAGANVAIRMGDR